ncbi:Ger(x)C family spore germination protein [Oceanobacillus halophilus]|uniref:Ger(X)C family spore germination protein n=1 Tax=Oceanobacillus halophilus TaxID=930130 RepID=A0A495A3S1_9BACI|nr:Ger(x)C family spore germination protein [Oceanobacillus halophilus]RKQ34260.1 Ger(x)C family spore germination protein [Oceanobacillus halophilus]
MKIKVPMLLFCLCILTGCWNNEELDESALVHGLGINKAEDSLHFSMEIIKPSKESSEGSASGENIIIEKEADTLIEAVRESIRDVKRRLHFDHNQLWVIGEKLAKDDMIGYLDLSRRDQMFRLNSYLFITEENPVDILETPTLYDDLSSTEIVSALEQTKHISGYTSVKMYDFFKAMEGPIPNAYIPIIQTTEENNQPITSLNGTAVINDGKMVGKLTNHETNGLNVLFNKASGGYSQLTMNGNKISIEINDSETTIEPVLKGNHLKAHIEVKILSTLADNTSKDTINKEWINQVEKKASDQIENHIHMTLDKLQQELKTDISGIGIETYRKYPQQWHHVQDNWDDVFSKADITVDVDTVVQHQGLINKSLERHRDKHHNNPYKFNRGN